MPMASSMCRDLVRELGYIEKSGCLRYIKINYVLITSICSRGSIAGDALERELGDIIASLKIPRDICSKMQETPENAREELYGAIYDNIRRIIGRMERIHENLERIYRLYTFSLVGIAVSIVLLSLSIILASMSNIYVFLASLIAGSLSIAGIAMLNGSLGIPALITIISSITLLLCGIQIGDAIKTIASIAVLATSILTSRHLLTR